MSKKENRKNKRKLNKKGFILAGAIVGVLVAIICIVGYSIFARYYYRLDRDMNIVEENPLESDSEIYEADEGDDYGEPVSEATSEEVVAIDDALQANLQALEEQSELYGEDLFNLLLVGVDTRGSSYGGRSDAMILVSINRETKKIVMTSFLRDIYLSIPRHGNNRLNAAHAFGGTDLLKETIQANFGISIDRCMVVNFYFVMDFVDAVDGVEVEITTEEIRVMNDYIKAHNKLLDNPEGTDILTNADAGKKVLNGNQALAYSRVRYVGTDFARTGRQREVILACLDKVKEMKLSELDALMMEFLPRIKTDLTEGDCAMLLLLLLDISSYEIENFAIPVDGTWGNARINEMAVLIVDFRANSKAWVEAVGTE